MIKYQITPSLIISAISYQQNRWPTFPLYFFLIAKVTNIILSLVSLIWHENRNVELCSIFIKIGNKLRKKLTDYFDAKKELTKSMKISFGTKMIMTSKDKPPTPLPIKLCRYNIQPFNGSKFIWICCRCGFSV